MRNDIKTKCADLKCLALAGVAALLITLTPTATQAASIIITTDTATELSGVFAAGSFLGSTDQTTASPSNFAFLPGGIQSLFVFRNGNTSAFGSSSAGSPDNPLFILGNSRTPLLGAISGSYTNSGGPTVNFTIGYIDTGSYFGTGGLGGNFSFTVAQGVPDGGTTALLLGLGLIGFFLTHKLTRLAPRPKAIPNLTFQFAENAGITPGIFIVNPG